MRLVCGCCCGGEGLSCAPCPGGKEGAVSPLCPLEQGSVWPLHGEEAATLLQGTRMHVCPPFFGRFPFYYEMKMAFVIWLLSPYTRGSSLIYRKFVHPTLSRKEKVRAAGLWGSRVPWVGAQDPGMPRDTMHLAPPRLFRQEIDTYIVQARERSCEMMVRFGKRGLNLAAMAAVQAATKVPGTGTG